MAIVFFNKTWFQLEEDPDVQTGKERGDQSFGEQCEPPLDAGGLKQPLVNQNLCEMQFQLLILEAREEISPSDWEQFVLLMLYLCVIAKIWLQIHIYNK